MSRDAKAVAVLLAEQLDAVPETGADPDLIEQAAGELRRLHEIERECKQLRLDYNELFEAIQQIAVIAAMSINDCASLDRVADISRKFLTQEKK